MGISLTGVLGAVPVSAVASIKPPPGLFAVANTDEVPAWSVTVRTPTFSRALFVGCATIENIPAAPSVRRDTKQEHGS